MHMGLAADGHLKNEDLLMGRLWGFILATSDAHLPNFLQCGLLDIWYSIPDTWYLILNIWYSLSDTQYTILFIWYSLSDTQYLVLDILYLMAATQYLLLRNFNTCYLLLNVWYLLVHVIRFCFFNTGYLNLTISSKKIVSFRSCSVTCSCYFWNINLMGIWDEITNWLNCRQKHVFYV